MGFFIPRLQARFCALAACIIRTIFIAIWHIPLFIYSAFQARVFSDFQYAGWIAQKGFLVTYSVVILMFILPWTIIYTWLFNNTNGSLLLVSVLHGSEIWLVYWLLNTGIHPNNLDNYWGYGAVLILVATLIVLKAGPENLSRKHKKIIRQPSLG